MLGPTDAGLTLEPHACFGFTTFGKAITGPTYFFLFFAKQFHQYQGPWPSCFLRETHLSDATEACSPGPPEMSLK